MNKKIDVKELAKSFTIIDGVLYRLKKDGDAVIVKASPIAGNKYIHVMWNGACWKYHRLLKVLSLGYDIPDGYTVDHIDTDKFNNELVNLQVLLFRDNRSKDTVFKDRASSRSLNFLLNYKGKRIRLGMGSYDTVAKRRAVWEHMAPVALFRQGLDQPLRDEMWRLIEGGDIDAGKALFKKELDAYLNK